MATNFADLDQTSFYNKLKDLVLYMIPASKDTKHLQRFVQQSQVYNTKFAIFAQFVLLSYRLHGKFTVRDHIQLMNSIAIPDKNSESATIQAVIDSLAADKRPMNASPLSEFVVNMLDISPNYAIQDNQLFRYTQQQTSTNPEVMYNDYVDFLGLYVQATTESDVDAITNTLKNARMLDTNATDMWRYITVLHRAFGEIIRASLQTKYQSQQSEKKSEVSLREFLKKLAPESAKSLIASMTSNIAQTLHDTKDRYMYFVPILAKELAAITSIEGLEGDQNAKQLLEEMMNTIRKQSNNLRLRMRDVNMETADLHVQNVCKKFGTTRAFVFFRSETIKDKDDKDTGKFDMNPRFQFAFGATKDTLGLKYYNNQDMYSVASGNEEAKEHAPGDKSWLLTKRESISGQFPIAKYHPKLADVLQPPQEPQALVPQPHLYQVALFNSLKQIAAAVQKRMEGERDESVKIELQMRLNTIAAITQQDYIHAHQESPPAESESVEWYQMSKFDDITVFPKESPDVGSKWVAQFISPAERDMSVFYQCLQNRVPLLILGYGQSGSGKTSALIQRQENKLKGITAQNGAVIELLKNAQVTSHIEQIEVQAFAMQANLWNKSEFSMQNTGPRQYIQQQLVLNESKLNKDPAKTTDATSAKDYYGDAYTIVFVRAGGTWVEKLKDSTAQKQEMGPLLVSIISNKRQANVTMNNPESSRDHVIVCLKLIHKTPPNVSLLYIGDLAGFENEMKGDVLEHILKFDIQYQGTGLFNLETPPSISGPDGDLDRNIKSQFGKDVKVVMSRLPVALLQDICDFKHPVGADVYDKEQKISDALAPQIATITDLYKRTMNLDYFMYVGTNHIFQTIQTAKPPAPTTTAPAGPGKPSVSPGKPSVGPGKPIAKGPSKPGAGTKKGGNADFYKTEAVYQDDLQLQGVPVYGSDHKNKIRAELHALFKVAKDVLLDNGEQYRHVLLTKQVDTIGKKLLTWTIPKPMDDASEAYATAKSKPAVTPKQDFAQTMIDLKGNDLKINYAKSDCGTLYFQANHIAFDTYISQQDQKTREIKLDKQTMDCLSALKTIFKDKYASDSVDNVGRLVDIYKDSLKVFVYKSALLSLLTTYDKDALIGAFGINRSLPKLEQSQLDSISKVEKAIATAFGIADADGSLIRKLDASAIFTVKQNQLAPEYVKALQSAGITADGFKVLARDILFNHVLRKLTMSKPDMRLVGLYWYIVQLLWQCVGVKGKAAPTNFETQWGGLQNIFPNAATDTTLTYDQVAMLQTLLDEGVKNGYTYKFTSSATKPEMGKLNDAYVIEGISRPGALTEAVLSTEFDRLTKPFKTILDLDWPQFRELALSILGGQKCAQSGDRSQYNVFFNFMNNLELRTLVQDEMKDLDVYRSPDYFRNYVVKGAPSGTPRVKITKGDVDTTPKNLDAFKTRIFAYVQWGVCTMWSKLKRVYQLQHNVSIEGLKGYTINKALIDMQTDMQAIARDKLVRNFPLLQAFPADAGNAVYNQCIDQNHYSEFGNSQGAYKAKSDDMLDPDNNWKGGVIFRPIAQHIRKNATDVTIQDLNIGVFTVVNMSRNKRTNNPPNPPYIDTTVLDYIVHSMRQPDLNRPYQNFVQDYMQYFQKYLKRFQFYSSLTLEQDITNLQKMIKRNNAATLIGTMQDSCAIKHLPIQFACSNPNLKLQALNYFGTQLNSEQSIFNAESSVQNNVVLYTGKHMFEDFLTYLTKVELKRGTINVQSMGKALPAKTSVFMIIQRVVNLLQTANCLDPGIQESAFYDNPVSQWQQYFATKIDKDIDEYLVSIMNVSCEHIGSYEYFCNSFIEYLYTLNVNMRNSDVYSQLIRLILTPAESQLIAKDQSSAISADMSKTFADLDLKQQMFTVLLIISCFFLVGKDIQQGSWGEFMYYPMRMMAYDIGDWSQLQSYDVGAYFGYVGSETVINYVEKKLRDHTSARDDSQFRQPLPLLYTVQNYWVCLLEALLLRIDNQKADVEQPTPGLVKNEKKYIGQLNQFFTKDIRDEEYLMTKANGSINRDFTTLFKSF